MKEKEWFLDSELGTAWNDRPHYPIYVEIIRKGVCSDGPKQIMKSPTNKKDCFLYILIVNDQGIIASTDLSVIEDKYECTL